jgi:MFS family permease
LLAGVSYLLLFIIDALASTITALIFLISIPETKPETSDSKPETVMQTVGGYFLVMKDKLFMAFIFASMIVLSVYTQMYSTLSVFLFQVHNVNAQTFGYMMSMNAAMVVLFQFWITKKLKGYSPMLMMILASAIYGIGFTIFGITGNVVLFFAGMVIITIGEMIHIPVAQTLASFFAPEDMRGRYMAVYGLGWAIPNSFAPFLAGLVMDNSNPNYVWYIAGILSLSAAFSYWLLFLRVKGRFSEKDRVLKDSPAT